MIRGNGGSDSIQGGNGNDMLYGGQGNDSIQTVSGNDVVYGMSGNDTLIVNELRSSVSLWGGTEKDIFRFDDFNWKATDPVGMAVIYDFEKGIGAKIDLFYIDANEMTKEIGSNHDRFTFIELNIDYDPEPDYKIFVKGVILDFNNLIQNNLFPVN